MTPDQWTRAQIKLVAAARGALRQFWRTLDLTDPVGARERLEVFWPTLVGDYGEIAATLAADRFEDETGLRALLSDPLPVEQVNARMRWGMSPMFGGEGEAAAIALLDGLLDELVKQPGRDTYFDSIADNGGRVARVPVGKTCAFCLMLASRGFVYASRKTAGELKKFHGGCDCRLAVEGEDTGNYNPDELYEQYLAARREAGGDAKDILAEMRKQQNTN